MNTTLKQIGEGEEFYIQFSKTTIFKRVYGEEEQKIAEFNYAIGDECPVEIIWQPSNGRGIITWFNFNKIDILEKLEVLDYHKNVFMSTWNYEIKENYELLKSSQANGGLWTVSIIKQDDKIIYHLLIGYENWYFRLEFSNPLNKSIF